MRAKYSVFLIGLFSLFGPKIWGQTNVTEQVEVKREYKPILGDSKKIRAQPYFFEATSKDIKQTYGFKDLLLKADTASNSIAIDSLKKNQETNLFPFYFRVAAGNFQTLIGDFNFNSLPNPKLSYGLSIRHFGLKGKLQNQEINTNRLSLFGKKIIENNYLSGELGLKLNSTPYYGYDNSLNNFSTSQVKQNTQKFNLYLGFGKQLDTSSGVTYYARLGGYYLKDSHAETEGHTQFLGGLGFKNERFSFNLATDYEGNKFTNPIQNFNTTLLRIAPYLTVNTDILKVKLGLNIVYEFGDRNQTYFFPDLSLNLQLIDGFDVFGGIKGDIIQNSFQSLLNQNPYTLGVSGNQLNSPVLEPQTGQKFNLQNSKESILIFAGIKGNFSSEFNYRAQIDLAQWDRLPFFVNTYQTPDNFIVIYDGNRTLSTKIYGELNYIFSDQVRLNTNLTINQFKLTTLVKPWYNPNYQFEFLAHYNPTTDWLITGSAFLVGRQFAQPKNIFNSTVPSPATPPYNTIDSHLDLSLSLEYKVSKKIGVFIQGNNLLNHSYLQFINYPVVGLNILGGLSIRF